MILVCISTGKEKSIVYRCRFEKFEHTFTMEKETDSKTILTFSMGAIDGKQINARHTIKIDSVELTEVK